MILYVLVACTYIEFLNCYRAETKQFSTINTYYAMSFTEPRTINEPNFIFNGLAFQRFRRKK